jgi:hypothetical protein
VTVVVGAMLVLKRQPEGRVRISVTLVPRRKSLVRPSVMTISPRGVKAGPLVELTEVSAGTFWPPVGELTDTPANNCVQNTLAAKASGNRRAKVLIFVRRVMVLPIHWARGSWHRPFRPPEAAVRLPFLRRLAASSRPHETQLRYSLI